MALIEVVGLQQKYGEREILKNIDIAIDKGEVFALIGPTGAGKTTLLRMIDLLDSPALGKIYFDGKDVTQSGRARLEARRRMAFVLQKPVVFNVSVFDNIACGLKWRRKKRGDIRQKVDNILDLIGLSTYKNRNARTLSGGETLQPRPALHGPGNGDHEQKNLGPTLAKRPRTRARGRARVRPAPARPLARTRKKGRSRNPEGRKHHHRRSRQIPLHGRHETGLRQARQRPPDEKSRRENQSFGIKDRRPAP